MRLLIVSHCPSPNTAALKASAQTSIESLALDAVELLNKAPLETTPDDVLSSDALLIGTTENFGNMAGLIKDFFERIYYPCLEKTRGLPVAVYIRAGQDGQGTKIQVERILKGLGWRLIDAPLILHGEWDEAFKDEVGELAMTLAAGLDAGIY